MSARATAVEICEVEGGEYTVSKTAAIKWSRFFNNGEFSLEDQPRSGRHPSIMNIDALRHELVEGAATTNRYSLQIVVG